MTRRRGWQRRATARPANAVVPMVIAMVVVAAGCTGGSGRGSGVGNGVGSERPGATSTGTTALPPAPVGSGAVDANATVEKIVDGDTVDLRIDGRVERVRLIGIDTPESVIPDAEVECYGPEASIFLAGLLPLGSAVRVERDVVNRDDYGRLLGYVYRADDGVFVNHELVRQGYATVLTIEPNSTYSRRFVEAAQEAEAADRGLWQACRG